MLRPFAALIALPFLALALSACGGSTNASASGDSAANMVPDTTRVFVEADTDTSSDQLKSADTLLKKFPGRAQVLTELEKSARQEGISVKTLMRSIGPETDIAILDVKQGTYVAFTKPRDEKAFTAILDAGKTPDAHKQIGDWTVFSDKQANLDLVAHVKTKLSDAQDFKDAMASLPGTAIAKAFVSSSAIRQGFKGLQQQAGGATGALGFDKADWVSAAALAHDAGVELQLHAHGKKAAAATKTYTPTFADQIPSDALLAISFNGGGAQLDSIEGGSLPQLKAAEQALGVKLRDLRNILGGEGALYVRAGNPIPEVTILAKESNEAKAELTIDKIVAHVTGGAAKAQPTTVDGVALKQLSLGPISIVYGAFDGKLVVTDSAGAIRELKSTNDKLVDSATFKDAKGASGLPDKTTGWVYANLKDAVPVIESLGRLGGGILPANADANLKPLRSFIAYGTKDGDVTSSVAFLQTN